MATRTFGVNFGAGIQVTEQSTSAPITPAQLGWAGYVGILDRGPTDELIVALSKEDALRKTGNFTPDSVLPDAIRDYFDLANGSGGLLLKRVTDGNELPAELPLYTRREPRSQLGTLKAHDGGRWGGRLAQETGEVAVVATDITATTLDSGVLTWKNDQWVDAFIELAGVPNVRYKVISSDDAGVLTVDLDRDMAGDLAAGGDPSNARWYVALEDRTDRKLEAVIVDGENDPDNEFGLLIYLDTELVISWLNLSVDPASNFYWEAVINGDSANHYVEAEDLWTGAIDPTVRPANHYGTRSSLTETVMFANLTDFAINSPGGGDPTFAIGLTSDVHLKQVITLTMTAATTFDAVSDKFGALGSGTLGVEFVPDVKWSPPFTVTAGGSPLAATDTLTIVYKPFVPDSMADGFLFPDVIDNGDKSYRIIGNTHESITVALGSMMSTDTLGGSDEFRVTFRSKFAGGRDGNADVSDNEYIEAWDKTNSKFLDLRSLDGNLGLVKFATPGVTSTAVQKAGAEFATTSPIAPHQYRYEVPSNLTTEVAIVDYLSNTLGKSAFGDYVSIAQSFAYVVDPESDNKLKLISTTGMIHGREASIARNVQGFHKAGAGLTATLPRIVKLTTGERVLNEEFLNPRGVAVIKKLAGNFVIWGDRTISSSTAFEHKFKHVRETLSLYIQVLMNSFDFSIFEINGPVTYATIRASLRDYFRNQYKIQALRNDISFEEAFILKLDAENNTAATQQAGDVNVEIQVAIVGTTERVKFKISEAGINVTAA